MLETIDKLETYFSAKPSITGPIDIRFISKFDKKVNFKCEH